MIHLPLVLIVLLPLLVLNQTTPNKISKNRSFHSSNNASGGDLSSEHGHMSYSISQVNYSSPKGRTSYGTKRVPQPLIISLKTIVYATTLTKKVGTGVVINGRNAVTKIIRDNEVYTGGLIRITGDNSYIVL